MEAYQWLTCNYCYTQTPPMVGTCPNCLRNPKHVPLTCFPVFVWFFLILRQFVGARVYSFLCWCPMLQIDVFKILIGTADLGLTQLFRAPHVSKLFLEDKMCQLSHRIIDSNRCKMCGHYESVHYYSYSIVSLW